MRSWSIVLPMVAMLWLVPAAAQVPSTDIFVFELVDGTPAHPIRVTDREGYDNQPQFLPDGQRLVFSSRQGESTDIYLFDLRTGEESRVTTTRESLYSPTPVPGKKELSVVRDYGNQDQQLWAFNIDRSGPGRLLLPNVNPVGYHAWANKKELLLFVLGDPMTLVHAEVGDDRGSVIAENPGRALARMPAGRRMTFVDKTSDAWVLTAIDLASGEREAVMPMPEGVEDYAWGPGETVWAGSGSTLYRRKPGDGAWTAVADLSEHGVHGITRLAFSPGAKRVAVVSARNQAPSTARAPVDLNSNFTDPELDVQSWVERFEGESREVFAARRDVLGAIGLTAGDRVVDVGAGTGLFTRLFADSVGPEGRVYAVDISTAFLAHINETASEAGLHNVTAVLGRVDDITLPTASADIAFVCDTYHHFEAIEPMLASMHRALAPGGRLVVIDFERIEGTSRPWILEHVRAGKAQFRAEIEAAGFAFQREVEIPAFEENYLIVFEKK